MGDLTQQQESAIAAFKDCIHLPGDGFHTLIIELCKQHQLPFQKVRSVVMKSQSKIERKIKHQFNDVSEGDLTMQAWMDAIDSKLTEFAKDNIPIMTSLKANSNYISAVSALKLPLHSEDDRYELLELLMQAYETEVFKPLLAMLHTNPLYWKLMLGEELNTANEAFRQPFSGYPQHCEAIAHLFELDKQARNLELSQ